jgi:hypothetical protein
MEVSKVYTFDGGTVQYFSNGKPFFRKMLDKSSRNEYHIAKLIHMHPQPNIVTMFDCTPNYIEMELLDVFHRDKSTMEKDIRAAIDQLHSLNVVYIDVKRDNFGYSHTNGCWKLFDFDGSGIVSADACQWIVAPPEWAMYKKIKHLEKPPLTDIDYVVFDFVFNKTNL